MKTKRCWICFLCITVVSILFIFTTSKSSAEDVASFYRGKFMSFIVPFSPGGGYDTYSRLLAVAMAKHMEATVVVINKPGAGGLVAINSLYDSPRKDGLTIAIAPEGLPLAQIIGTAGVRYDCRKFGWLGSIAQDVRFISVSSNSPYQSVKDLKELKQPKAAITSVTSPAGPSLIVALEGLGMENARIIAGYPGSTEAVLAVKNGEADFSILFTPPMLKRDPTLKPLVVIDKKRHPEFPQIPAITEFEVTPEVKKMMEIIMSGKASERSLITPPGVSNEKINFLKKVFTTCCNDPKLLDKAKRLNLDINPLTGEEAEDGVKKVLNISDQDVEKLKYVILKKYL